MRLLGALACEEVGCGLGENETDGKVRGAGKGVQDIGDFNGCYGAAGCEKEMVFAVVGVLRRNEWGVAGNICSGDVVFGVDHLQHRCDISSCPSVEYQGGRCLIILS